MAVRSGLDPRRMCRLCRRDPLFKRLKPGLLSIGTHGHSPHIAHGLNKHPTAPSQYAAFPANPLILNTPFLTEIFNQTVDDLAAPANTAAMQPDLDLVFAALSDPTRRAILSMLLEDDMAVTDVAAPFQMSLAAISKHLAILTAARLIAQEKRGRINWCKLEPDAMREAFTWMQGFGHYAPLDLDAFERFLQSELDESFHTGENTLGGQGG